MKPEKYCSECKWFRQKDYTYVPECSHPEFAGICVYALNEDNNCQHWVQEEE